MDCKDIQELIPEFILDALTPEEQVKLRQHLDSGCLDCNREFSEMIEAYSILAETLEPVAPKSQLKHKLLTRIQEEPQLVREQVALAPEQSKTTSASASWARTYFPFVAASLLAVAAGSLLANFSRFSTQGSNLVQVDQQLKREWEHRVEQAQATFGAPRAQLIGFDASLQQAPFQAAVFYDGIAQQLHVLVSRVAPPPAGQQPYLWLLDKEGKVLQGFPLEYHDRQRASAVLDLASLPEQISGALITHEPIGNPTEPQGPVVGRATLKQTT